MIKEISERIAYFLRKQEILKQNQIRIKWNKWRGNKLEISEIKNSHSSNLNLQLSNKDWIHPPTVNSQRTGQRIYNYYSQVLDDKQH